MCQERGNIIYFYKDVNVNFFIMFKLKELPCGKVK